jgi:hypothetical protein
MMITRRQVLMAMAGTSALLGGCASSPPGPMAERRTYCLETGRLRRTVCTPEPIPSAAAEAQAKRFEAAPGLLTVFVVRSAAVDAARVLTVTVDSTTRIGTLPRSLIRLRITPGEHQLEFEWNDRMYRQQVKGSAGDVRFVELAGSSWPLERSYYWSDADPAGAKLRARDTRLIADA